MKINNLFNLINYFTFNNTVLPKDGPKITGGKDRYSIGDTVNVNCTSKGSKPAADIQWIINGKPVRVRIYNLFMNNQEIIIPNFMKNFSCKGQSFLCNRIRNQNSIVVIIYYVVERGITPYYIYCTRLCKNKTVLSVIRMLSMVTFI